MRLKKLLCKKFAVKYTLIIFRATPDIVPRYTSVVEKHRINNLLNVIARFEKMENCSNNLIPLRYFSYKYNR